MNFEGPINAKLEKSYMKGDTVARIDMEGTELSADFTTWTCSLAGMTMWLSRRDLSEISRDNYQ